MAHRRWLYIHQRPEWPAFHFDLGQLAQPLAAIRQRQGHLLGYMRALGFDIRQQALLATVTDDVLKTSEIEGKRLNPGEVRSSVARHLGIETAGLPASSRHVDGVVEMLLDATCNSEQPLTPARLFGWHASLFPTGHSGLSKIATGAWRTGPMEVVSGAYGRERVHFAAPPASRLDSEMTAFLDWFNTPSPMDEVLKAAQAHFWFVTIHPFEDGNGRIARAISDLMLTRSERAPQRFYSMSAQIMRERRQYYHILEETQRGLLDITSWMQWFLACLGRAIDAAELTLAGVMAKGKFWQKLEGAPLNDRQRAMLNRLLDGLDPALSTSKWAQLAKASHDTALRDITDLVDRGILVRSARGGRSTAYRLA